MNAHFRSKQILHTLALLALALLGLLSAAPAGAQWEVIRSDDGAQGLDDDNSPVRAVLAMDRLPLLGETAWLNCTIFSFIDAPGMIAEIELPAGALVREGSARWEGDLAAGETIEFGAGVAFTQPGDTAVRCRALSRLDERNVIGDLEAIYFSVGETETLRGFAPQPAIRVSVAEMAVPGDGPVGKAVERFVEIAAERVLPPPPALDALLEAGQTKPAPEAPAGLLTVTGTWSHPDRSGTQVGAREMLIELVNGTTWVHLAWCYTDLEGVYTCPAVTNPGGAGVRTMLHSYTCYNGAFASCDKLIVKNPDISGTDPDDSYRFTTAIVVLADGTQSIGSWFVPTNNDDRYAFWAERDLIDTWRHIWWNGGAATTGGAGSSGPTTVLWKIDSTDGNYYSHGGSVHLQGDAPLSDTTVIHEYSHNIMYNVYVTHQSSSYPSTPNCNPHAIEGSSSTGCAWVEGWAEFIPSVVNNDPTYRWASGATRDLEGPSWTTIGWDDGDTVEGRVAGALWDIYDVANEGDDQYTEVTSPRFFPFWHIFWAQQDATFSAHWSAWRTYGYNNSSAGPLMSMYQSTIDYRIGPANDDFANAAVVGSLPYTVNDLYTANATTQGYDPAHPCGSIITPKQSRSVWYRFSPPISAQYNLNTTGSNYDTVLAVWTGSFGSLTNRACNDDSGGTPQSSLNAVLYYGTTYYVEATSFSTSSAGYLDLHILLNPPLAPTNFVATVSDPLAAPADPGSRATADEEGQIPLPAPEEPAAARVTLTWTDNSIDETHYHVEKWNGSSYAVVAYVDGTSWIDYSVSPGTTYYYRVAGHRHYDDVYSGYATANTTVPLLPASPVVIITTSGSADVLLLWSYLSQNTAGYDIWESAAPYFSPGGGGSTLLGSRDMYSTAFFHNSALGNPAANHYYVVVGKNSINQKANSNRVGEFDFALTPGSP